MKIAILTIGNELTSGKTQDTNSSFIARAMETQGWGISAMTSVGDDEGTIRDALDWLLARSSAVIVTGGLGPTADDITTAAIARAFGLGLVLDEKCLVHLQARFERLRIPWTENNAKQAVFPEGAETIFNPTGSAWGFAVKKNGKIVAVIPGVPSESRRMLPEGVIPLLRREFPDAVQYIETRVIKLFGISESSIDQISVSDRARVNAASRVSILSAGMYACSSSCRTSTDVTSRLRCSTLHSKKSRAGPRSGCSRPTAYMKTFVSTKITTSMHHVAANLPSPEDARPSPARHRVRRAAT